MTYPYGDRCVGCGVRKKRTCIAGCVVQHVRPITVDEVFCSGALAQRLERRSRLRVLGFESCAAVSNLRKGFSIFIALLHSLYEYLVRQRWICVYE